MNSREFVIALRQEVLDDNHKIYKNLLEDTSPSEATDQYWKNLLAFYSDIDADQKKVFLQAMHQVIADTIANILGVLDGVSMLESQEEDFVLSYSDDQLNGDLQDIFLEMQEG